jgi:ribosome-associated translation inhibitor RaiA
MINFKNIPDSKSLHKHLTKEVDRLDRQFAGLKSCQISLDLPYQHRYPGNLYNFEIDIETQESLQKVRRAPSMDGANSDTFAMFREAFHEMQSKLSSCLSTKRSQNSKSDEYTI